MAKTNAGMTALNRGEVGKLALARVDVDRLRLSAETMVNFVPRTVGPMTLRPGLAYTGGHSQLRSLGDPDAPAVPCALGLNRLQQDRGVYGDNTERDQ